MAVLPPFPPLMPDVPAALPVRLAAFLPVVGIVSTTLTDLLDRGFPLAGALLGATATGFITTLIAWVLVGQAEPVNPTGGPRPPRQA